MFLTLLFWAKATGGNGVWPLETFINWNRTFLCVPELSAFEVSISPRMYFPFLTTITSASISLQLLKPDKEIPFTDGTYLHVGIQQWKKTPSLPRVFKCSIVVVGEKIFPKHIFFSNYMCLSTKMFYWNIFHGFLIKRNNFI